MKCPVCNKENGPGVNFCEGCGRRIPRCPTCGMELTNRDRFCSNDGTRLSDDLLILVPEESILQAPVWSGPVTPAAPTVASDDSAWAAPAADDLSEGTMKAGSAPEPFAPEVPELIDDPFEEKTVRVTAVSGGSRFQDIPPVRNSDPLNIPAWDQMDVKTEPPQRAFCENCGKRIAPGSRFCSDCRKTVSAASAKPKQKSGSKKGIWVILLILLLLLGLAAGGYALINSELFDWDSSNRSSKTEDADEEEEEEGEDGEDTADPSDDNSASAGVAEDPTVPVAGVEDPVTTDPSDTPEPTDEVTEAPSEAEEDPLMYWIDNCDKMYLTAEDLEGFDAQMCTYARNACYAKSGRMFNSATLQEYFSQFDWYNPTVSPDKFNGGMLNAYQAANINVVLEYERAHGFG